MDMELIDWQRRYHVVGGGIRLTNDEILLQIGDSSFGEQKILAHSVGRTIKGLYRDKKECTGGFKSRYADGHDMVCLKKYNESKLHPRDLRIIRRHALHKTADGTEYYSFTENHTLEEIKGKKKPYLAKGYVDKGNRIFSSVERIRHVPVVMVPAHDEKDELWWDCNDDLWNLDKGDR